MKAGLSIVALCALLALVAGCGDDQQGASATDTTAFSDQQTTASDSGSSEKPEVEVPDGPAPTELQVKDLKEGTGPGAEKGDELSVNYVGVLYEDGAEFDNSYDRGQAFDFQLGSGSVIPGWDQGLVGMKKGGRRELIIPPDLAYGPPGQPPTIPPDATLVFVIDLLDIK